jgi:hypothetical protein
MKAARLVFLLALAILPATASLPSAHRSAPATHVAYETPRSYYEARVNLAEAEQPRIRRHLAAVEALLRARPTTGLTDAQRRNRLARLDDLHAYWTRGEFPKNRDFPDRLIPYFIDAEGVPCAMGHLVIESGHRAFAEEIRATRNNAYIAEIAAVDGRLAAWGEVNGMTLEEAAMVQPGYGPPRLSSVYQVRLDSLARPWALGPDDNNIGFVGAFYRDSAQWKHAASTFGGSAFCVTRSGLPLLVGSEVLWKGSRYENTTTSRYACEWARNDSDAWIGTRHGLVRMRRGGSEDLLTSIRYSTPLASDTVIALAVTGTSIWAGTPRGLYRRIPATGSDTDVTVWDSATVRGKNITGLKAGKGQEVWVGVEGTGPNGNRPNFSTRGLRRYNGSAFNLYVSAMSSVFVPGDTVFALASRDSASAWIAVRAGFYEFTPGTGGGRKVADIPSGVAVYDLVGDRSGFYAATSAGVYQFRNDSLVSLVVSLRPGNAPRRPGPATRLRVLSADEARATPGLRTVHGQKVGSGQAAPAAHGIYLVEPADPAR